LSGICPPFVRLVSACFSEPGSLAAQLDVVDGQHPSRLSHLDQQIFYFAEPSCWPGQNQIFKERSNVYATRPCHFYLWGSSTRFWRGELSHRLIDIGKFKGHCQAPQNPIVKALLKCALFALCRRPNQSQSNSTRRIEVPAMSVA